MSTVWMAAHSRPQQHLRASLRDCIMSPTDPPQIILASLFFYNDPSTTEIYTLSLHDALPIFNQHARFRQVPSSSLHQQAHMSTVWMAAHSRPQQDLQATLRDSILPPTAPPHIILASLAQHHSPLMQCLLCRSHRQLL